MISFIINKSKTLKSEIQYAINRPKPRKFLFDHLPKCGGSTLKKYLRLQYPKRKIFSIDGRNPPKSVELFKNFSQKKRYSYDLVEGHQAHYLINYIHPDSLKITVLRNPIDRIISHYFHVIRDPQHYLHSKVIEADMNLEEYVTSGISHELQNWYTTRFSGLTIIQAEKEPELSIIKAKENILNNYNIIGFLDHFSNFMDIISKISNFKINYDGSKTNTGKNKPRSKDISKSAIEKIKNVNFLDMKLFEEIRSENNSIIVNFK